MSSSPCSGSPEIGREADAFSIPVADAHFYPAVLDRTNEVRRCLSRGREWVGNRRRRGVPILQS